MEAFGEIYVFVIAPLGIVGWVLASIVYRRRKGKPIFPKPPATALFAQRGASGRTVGAPFGRMGGARNSLLIWVTPETFAVVPMFPLNLMFLPEIYGLEHEGDLRDVGRIRRRQGRFGAVVSVQFIDVSGQVVELELTVKDPDSFIHALRRSRA